MSFAVWKETPVSVRWLHVTSFLMNLGFYALIPYMTLHLTKSYGWTLALSGLLLSVRQFSQQGFAFLGGIMADRFGYKGTMILGLLIRASGFASFAICSETWHFFVAAVMSGLGGSLFEPAVSACYAVLTPEPIRKDVFAFKNMLNNIGVAGSQIVGVLLVTVDFIWLSLFAGGMFYLCALIVFFNVPAIFVQQQKGDFWSGLRLILRDRPFLLYTAVLVGFYYLYMQMFLTIPKLTEDVLGSKAGVGTVLATVSVSVIVLQMRIVRMLEVMEQRFFLIGTGTLIMGAGLFMLAFSHSLLALMADAFVFAVGTMISVPYLVDMVARFAPREHLGAYYGFNSYALALGGSLGTFAGGWAYDLGQHLKIGWFPWLMCLIIGGVVFLGMLGLERSQRSLKPV